MSSQLELHKIQVKYGAFVAVADVSMDLQKGDIGCLLGPSGCGKTTVLRAIAGFEALSGGEIKINSSIVSSAQHMKAPEQRRVGMVFQDFALFPHLRIDRNVGFGLSEMSRAQRGQRVAEMLELVGLSGHARAYPHELSGGQQQRVALARAMAPNPEVLLLDEPFSGLDSELREQLASEIRQILKQNQITAILVTHDQHEAFAMADHITVLQRGVVAQADSSYNLYHNPASEFVASFIGQGAIIDVTVDESGQLSNALGSLDNAHTRWTAGEALRLLVRPDDIKHASGSTVTLAVTAKSFRGAQNLYELELPDGQRVPCLTASHIDIEIGQRLPVKFDLQHVVVFR